VRREATGGETVSEKRVVRRLAALLVADAVGYSGLMRVDETATHLLVRSDLDTLFAPNVRVFGGRVVKTTGDGLLAEFPSIVDCVECAMEIQKAVAAQQAAAPSGTRLPYRIGINLGDIIVETDDIYGDSVNVASRLQALAEPGGILLSGDAYRLLKGKLTAMFEDLGEQVIKGLAEPIRVFRVGRANLKARESGAVVVAPIPSVPSIAVLPFENLSGDPDQGYFSDGITNDVITDLSKFPELFVIASHTVFAYKGRPVKVQEVGRELGVRYVVEGSIQRTGDRIRINTQLIEAATGRHLWAERYDRPMPELFGLQDEIVQTIVGTLTTRVDLSERQRSLVKETESLQAYDFYLRGRDVWFFWTEEGNRRAEEFFAKAIEMDPNFARAYGYLSYTLVQRWLGGWAQTPEVLERACNLAIRAVALGPSDFENHWSLGAAYVYSRELEKGMAALERAVSLNPNSPGLLIDWADALVYAGRSEEAITAVERAMRYNPIHPDWYLWTLGMALYHAGRFEEALSALRKVGDPPNLLRRHLAATYVRLGRMGEARRVAAEFLKQDPTYTLQREQNWPYKDRDMLRAFVADLRDAGLPEPDDARDSNSPNQGSE
jgi:adenylate cyclase